MKVVETFNLSKTYVQDVLGVEYGRLKIRLRDRQVDALKDLTLAVEQGEIFGLLGPNGAGKTTTIKILMGIHFATEGQARLFGRPLGDLEVKRRIGFLPENPYFYDYLKGWEFLEFYGRLYDMPHRLLRTRIEELLDLVGLSHAANLPLKGYSKGMNQRIGLAQALLNDPRLVILDEPQSGLDPLGRKEVRDIILRLRKEGRTVLFSSHILSDAEMICDRVGILFKGKLIDCGSMSELLSTRVLQYELVVEGVSHETLQAFEGVAESVLNSDMQTLLILKEETDVQAAIARTVETGGKIVSLTPRTETLEQYFIRQVKGEGK
ncbi:MAG TPA: ABC transporter ATP-binding protein [Candidatus Sumerlaeota bacterium]|nr:ABC transporter ATP-binding protein [Candidatus Sumerlaeota bacterium]HPS00060.1 ABC transporter ATP-binding protein [Candidatus Sumerlaeota bacterium]